MKKKGKWILLFMLHKIINQSYILLNFNYDKDNQHSTIKIYAKDNS